MARVSGCSGAPPSRPLPEEEAVVVNGVLVLVVGFVGGGLRVEKEPAGCVVISSTRTPATAAEVLLLRFGFGDILLRGGIMIADGKGGGSLARTDGRTVVDDGRLDCIQCLKDTGTSYIFHWIYLEVY